MRVTRQPRGFAIGLLLAGIAATGCSVEFGAGDSESVAVFEPVEATDEADIVFGSTEAGIAIDPRLFGTNVPAWVNPTRTAQPWFTTAVAESGTTLLRFPGGSWSNWYQWHNCLERSDGCPWDWALAPQDYAKVVVDTGLPAMWTANVNVTAEANAALVAFFNGEVGDERVIGTDPSGVDWRTVGHWAERRAELGFPDPVPIRYWEIGNEVYGAKASKGPQCADWGWEEVWTCDGAEYMLGVDGQQGFNEMAEAMRAVDPSIEIGAVGVSPAESWADFGTEVFAEGVDTVDFYIVHRYAFGGRFGKDEVLDAHADLRWPAQLAALDVAALDAGFDEPPPVAVTEYNLVAWQDADEQAVMTTMYNLFHLVGNIGEMASAEVDIATQWGLLSGLQESGTDYGVIDGDTQRVYPSFFALRLWSAMADELIAVSDHPDLMEYATVGPDGSVAVLVANDGAAPIAAVIDVPADAKVTADVVVADSLDSRTVTYNGVAISTIDDLVGVEPLHLGAASGPWPYDVPPFSVVVLRFEPA